MYTPMAYLYTVSTIRVTAAQKRHVEEGKRLLEGAGGCRLTQGEAIAQMAKFTLLHREILAEDPHSATTMLDEDPLLDPSLLIDMGPTDVRTVDRVLYRKR